MSSQSADGGAPLRASKPEPASFLRNETTISKLASIFYQFAFISSREREKRRERELEVSNCASHWREEAMAVPVKAALAFLVLTVASK